MVGQWGRFLFDNNTRGEHNRRVAAAHSGSCGAASGAQRDGRGAVFVVRGDSVQQRNVSPAASKMGDDTLLPTGVDVGDTVVVSPPAQLKDGDRIKVAAKAEP